MSSDPCGVPTETGRLPIDRKTKESPYVLPTAHGSSRRRVSYRQTVGTSSYIERVLLGILGEAMSLTRDMFTCVRDNTVLFEYP